MHTSALIIYHYVLLDCLGASSLNIECQIRWEFTAALLLCRFHVPAMSKSKDIHNAMRNQTMEVCKYTGYTDNCTSTIFNFALDVPH